MAAKTVMEHLKSEPGVDISNCQVHIHLDDGGHIVLEHCDKYVSVKCVGGHLTIKPVAANCLFITLEP